MNMFIKTEVTHDDGEMKITKVSASTQPIQGYTEYVEKSAYDFKIQKYKKLFVLANNYIGGCSLPAVMSDQHIALNNYQGALADAGIK